MTAERSNRIAERRCKTTERWGETAEWSDRPQNRAIKPRSGVSGLQSGVKGPRSGVSGRWNGVAVTLLSTLAFRRGVKGPRSGVSGRWNGVAVTLLSTLAFHTCQSTTLSLPGGTRSSATTVQRWTASNPWLSTSSSVYLMETVVRATPTASTVSTLSVLHYHICSSHIW